MFNVTGVMGGGVTIEGDSDRFCLGMRERLIGSFVTVVVGGSEVFGLISTGSCLIFTLDFCRLFVRVTVCVFGSICTRKPRVCRSLPGKRLDVVCDKSLSGSVSIVVVVVVV